ncbi:hypothetical protein BH10ACT1_BH10ACT1_05600 [soil metagenome]
MPNGGRRLIDAEVCTFLQGPVSAMLGTVDGLLVADVTRIGGLVPLDDGSMRVLVAANATVARTNAAEPGSAVSVLVTDITDYRSLQWKGTVVEWGQPTPGDRTLLHDHVERFLAAAPDLGLDVEGARRSFPTEVVALEVTFDALFDQTPGPAAGRRIQEGS